MANLGYDRTLINTRERPLSSDINQLQSQLDRSIRETLMQVFRGRISGTNDAVGNPISGFVGDGFKVRAATGLSVTVTAGLGFLDLPSDVPYATSPNGALQSALGGILNADDLARYKPLPLTTSVTISAIPAGPATGSTRTDIVEARMSRAVTNPTSRDVLDLSSGLFLPTSVNKTLSYAMDGSVGMVNDPASSTASISYKVGVVNGIEPSVTPGYVKLATIYASLGNMTSAVAHANIADQRNILHPYGRTSFGVTATIPGGLAVPPNSVSLHGPPGLECIVVKDAPSASPGGGSRFSVWLFGGPLSANARGSMNANVVRAFTASEFLVVQNLGTTFGSVLLADSTNLANANIAGAAGGASFLGAPVGAQYMKTSFAIFRASVGAIDNTSIPDPANVEIIGSVQTY